MRTYVVTTGILFALLTVAHVLRIFHESPALGTDPWYLLITAATAVLSVWAYLVLRRERAGR
jgi:hypothetical protein